MYLLGLYLTPNHNSSANLAPSPKHHNAYIFTNSKFGLLHIQFFFLMITTKQIKDSLFIFLHTADFHLYSMCMTELCYHRKVKKKEKKRDMKPKVNVPFGMCYMVTEPQKNKV